MSFITDILLTVTSVEDTGTSGCPVWPGVDFVQNWLRENHRNGGQLFEVAAPQGPGGYCPDGIFVGQFNHLRTDDFVAAVRLAPWQWREKVRLFVRDERKEYFEQRAV